jgi:peroxiredoxin
MIKSIAFILSMFHGEQDSLQAIQLLQKIEKNSQSIVNISYNAKRTVISHEMDDSLYVVDGKVWLKILPSDTIFGGRFHLKGSDRHDHFDYYYDGQFAWEYRHTSKKLLLVNPYLYPNTFNNPAKSRTALGAFQELLVDTKLVSKLMENNPSLSLLNKNDHYIIELAYPINKYGALQTKWITISRQQLQITEIKSVSLWNGTKQTIVYSINDIQVNKESIDDSISLTPMGRDYAIEDLTRKKAAKPEEVIDLSGKIADDFFYPSYQGESFQLSGSKGKYVLLDFWESWCGYCILNIPNIKKLHQEYGPKGLKVIGVTVENRKQIEKIIERNQLTYTTIFADEKILDNYKVTSRPTYVLIDPSGKIILYTTGDLDSIIKEVKERLK